MSLTIPKSEKQASHVLHAFKNDALADHDAVALAQLIAQRKLSIAEVTEAAIARAELVNGTLNGIECGMFDAARTQAKNAPLAGVFRGVPTFIKDNAELRGLPTRNGSRATSGKIALKDGPFTEQYLSQGFIVLGKTTLPEFGFNATTEFVGEAPTRNPWHTEYSSGGSSGGSAALVAAGVVPIAHANDGGGSIRLPAACCGLVGLKPTRNRHLNNQSAASMPINIVSEGVVTRSVRDTAVFFSALEKTFRNPKLAPIGEVQGPGKKSLRIGLVVDSITGTPTCPETRATVEETGRIMESQGHRVEIMPLPVPKTFLEDFTLYWSLLAFLLKTFGKQAVAPDFDANRLDPFSMGLVDLYRKKFLNTPGMLYRLHQAEKNYAKSFAGWDAVLSPVLGHVVPKLGYLQPDLPFEQLFERLGRYVAFTPLNNVAGSPAISLPMGMSVDNVPIGVQFQAAHGQERTLLEIAFALEEAKPWRKINAG